MDSDDECLLAALILFDTDSSSGQDEDEEVPKKRRKRRHNLFVNRETEGCYETLINRHLMDNETNFKEYFRVTPYLFNKILGTIEVDLKSEPSIRYPKPIEPKLKLCLLFRYLATGESMRSLAFQFRVSHQYISVIIRETLEVIKDKFLNEAIPEPTTDMLNNNAKQFLERLNYPNCVGAIHGKHVKMVCTSNKYKDSSIAFFAVVDADNKYVAVEVGDYGSEGDNCIFSRSLIAQKIYGNTFNIPSPATLPGTNVEVNHVIVGNGAFTLHPNIMRPYPEKQTQGDKEKTYYNYRHIETLRTTEIAFGLMGSYFGIFNTPIHAKAETIDSIVVVSCILYNLLRINKIPAPIEQSFGQVEDVVSPSALISLAATRSRTKEHQTGQTVRQLFNDFFNGIGRFDCQG